MPTTTIRRPDELKSQADLADANGTSPHNYLLEAIVRRSNGRGSGFRRSGGERAEQFDRTGLAVGAAGGAALLPGSQARDAGQCARLRKSHRRPDRRWHGSRSAVVWADLDRIVDHLVRAMTRTIHSGRVDEILEAFRNPGKAPHESRPTGARMPAGGDASW